MSASGPSGPLVSLAMETNFWSLRVAVLHRFYCSNLFEQQKQITQTGKTCPDKIVPDQFACVDALHPSQ